MRPWEPTLRARRRQEIFLADGSSQKEIKGQSLKIYLESVIAISFRLLTRPF